MTAYLLLIFFVCAFGAACFNAFTKNRSQRLPKTVFLSASFLALFACSALRHNIGYDYAMYAKGFALMRAEGFSNVAYLDWEWGFTILTKAIGLITGEVRIYMAAMALLCLAGPFCAILRHSKKAWLSVLLYINLYFFYCTMNFIRQSIAISIVMFAYTFMVERKFWRFLLLVLLASSFHLTALIMVPVYFVINFKPSPKVPLMYAYLVLWVFISSDSTLDLLTGIIHSEYRDSVFLKLGLGAIHAVFPTLVVASGMFLLFRFVQPKDIANFEKPVVMQTNLMYFSYLWILIMLKHAIFERFSYYSYVFVILYIPELIAFADQKYKHHANIKFNKNLISPGMPEALQNQIISGYRKKGQLFNAILIFLVLLLSFAYNIYGLSAYDRGPHGIYPYATWING